jgi:3-oxoacyl-[acyl-carrier-protein] synthase III
MKQHFRITGTAVYLPPQVVTSEEVDSRMNAPSGWTAQHSQVLTRFECLSPHSIATMAAKASLSAVQNANLKISNVDLIIDCSTSVYQPIPCNAAVYQRLLGDEALGIPCLDVHGTCLGFVLALNMANGLFASGAYQRILIVASEGALAGVNWNQWESASVMGDGAAAIVLERIDPEGSFGYEHATYSDYAEACEVRSGGHRQGPHEYRKDLDADYRFHMNGPLLFKVARQKLPALVDRVFASSDGQRNETHIVPHQASPFALESVRRLIDHPPTLFHNRASRIGNMVAASIPTVLHQVIAEGLVRRGSTVMLLGTSAGYSQAACTFQF